MLLFDEVLSSKIGWSSSLLQCWWKVDIGNHSNPNPIWCCWRIDIGDLWNLSALWHEWTYEIRDHWNPSLHQFCWHTHQWCESVAWSFCHKSNRITHQQCEGTEWNFLCWSNWLKSCMRMNPTISQSKTLRTERSKGNTGRYYKTFLFWPLPSGWLSFWWISTIALDLIILQLVTEHYSFWWKVVRKQCILFQSFGWFASWFVCQFDHWFHTLNPMIYQNKISSGWAQIHESISWICEKKDHQKHQELGKSYNCSSIFFFSMLQLIFQMQSVFILRV